jgi:hypothetical protein
MAKPKPKPKLCSACRRARDDPHFKNPPHLVHPVDETPGLFDVRAEAVCQICRARWRLVVRNEAVLVAELIPLKIRRLIY